MKAIFVISLVVAVVAAGNWNTNDLNNRNNLNDRDAKHQKFIIDLLRHLQQDIHQKDFMQYSQTIRIDNKNDYQDLNKVYYLMTLFNNGWFELRGNPFSLFRERNIVTTKALVDFFGTMNNWNTVAMNLIWARRNINEYQFWHLLNLLVTHNRHFDRIVLPAGYEVFPHLFFTADVMDQATNLRLTLNTDINKKQLVVLSNYTTGVFGSNDDDGNDNVYDLNDIDKNSINDWNTLVKVVKDIKMKQRNNRNIRVVKTTINNNDRNLNQGNKFDNNGEDRMVYFTEDVGLNNYFYFTRIDNTRILKGKQMYNNDNNKETLNMLRGNMVNRGEHLDKINRRGERYLYNMQQLLARYNLERQSNGLNNVQDLTLDGIIENGVYPNLRYTNGIQMPNRINNLDLNNKNNMKLIQITKDFENRFYRVIDQGFVQTQNGQKVNLRNHNGINILGNLLQGNTDSVNTQFYRYLEYYYRLLLGGNNIDKVDWNDNRFVPTVLDHYETSMRDSVFWQIIKRINNIVLKFQDKLMGYKTKDVNFDGVEVKNVKVSDLITVFKNFDSDITNGITMNFNNKMTCNTNNDNSGDDNSSSNSDSDSDSDEHGNKRNNRRHNSGSDSNSSSGEDLKNTRFNNKRHGNKYDNNYRNVNRNNRHNSNSDSNSKSNSNSNSNSDSSSDSGSSEENQFNRFNTQGTSKQVDYFKRTGDIITNLNTWKYNIVGRTRRLTTQRFTVNIDVKSNRNQNGIVRIFLGPRINNKQQLNDNRFNFVELDQFIVKLTKGTNNIMRHSVDFKNVVGDPETMSTIYFRALNLLNKKTNNNDMKNFNYDTNNNNHGFPHRLVLPKGTQGGEDYTLFVIVNGLYNDKNDVQYTKMDTLLVNDNSKSKSDSSSSSGDSNSSGNSNSNENDSNDSMGKMDKMNRMNIGNNKNMNTNLGGNNKLDGNWGTNNGIMIHNINNGNKNVGNGNGILDNRAMGFPLDRNIIDVAGFLTKNMFFKDVKVFHKGDNNDKNHRNNKWNNNVDNNKWMNNVDNDRFNNWNDGKRLNNIDNGINMNDNRDKMMMNDNMNHKHFNNRNNNLDNGKHFDNRNNWDNGKYFNNRYNLDNGRNFDNRNNNIDNGKYFNNRNMNDGINFKKHNKNDMRNINRGRDFNRDNNRNFNNRFY